jgi:hypothetical protein
VGAGLLLPLLPPQAMVNSTAAARRVIHFGETTIDRCDDRDDPADSPSLEKLIRQNRRKA